MAAGVTTLLMTFFMTESYAPTILQKKCDNLRAKTRRSDLQSVLYRKLSKSQLLLTSIIRPVKAG